MVSSCAIKYCPYEKPERSYFTKPKDKELAEKWWNFVAPHRKNQHLTNSMNYRICEFHFELHHMYEGTSKKGRKHLCRTAVPSILSAEPLTKMIEKAKPNAFDGTLKCYERIRGICRFCNVREYTIEVDEHIKEMFDEITTMTVSFRNREI